MGPSAHNYTPHTVPDAMAQLDIRPLLRVATVVRDPRPQSKVFDRLLLAAAPHISAALVVQPYSRSYGIPAACNFTPEEAEQQGLIANVLKRGKALKRARKEGSADPNIVTKTLLIIDSPGERHYPYEALAKADVAVVVRWPALRGHPRGLPPGRAVLVEPRDERGESATVEDYDPTLPGKQRWLVDLSGIKIPKQWQLVSDDVWEYFRMVKR